MKAGGSRSRVLKPESTAGTKPLTILLAEDDLDSSGLLRLMLESMGHVVFHARTGLEALQILARTNIRILLLDLMMPVLDGFEVLRRLEKIPQQKRPTVLAMSTFEEFIVKARHLGAAVTLKKPFGVEELREGIRLALGKKTAAAPAPGRRRKNPSAVEAGNKGAEDLGRIERLHCLRVMASEPDQALDELVRATADLLNTPMALISIITEDRQWWKAMYGIQGELARMRGTPVGDSFCTHAVAARAPLVVADARRHPVFQNNPLVRAGILNSYAGIPLQIPGIGALGTLCVLDRSPRTFTSADLELLGLLAERVAAEIEWRERDRLGERPQGTFRYLSLMDEQHGIYNDRAFRSIAGAVGRLTMIEQGSFCVVALGHPRLTPNPVPERAAETALVVAALRESARPGDVIGRLGSEYIGALLSRSDEARASSFLADALAREARLRGSATGRKPVGAKVISQGHLVPDALLQKLERELDAGRPAGRQPGKR